MINPIYLSGFAARHFYWLQVPVRRQNAKLLEKKNTHTHGLVIFFLFYSHSLAFCLLTGLLKAIGIA
jgi:hypothetical protein